jgi:ABC-type phosphate/phosphonate transport system substrate-binding protein
MGGNEIPYLMIKYATGLTPDQFFGEVILVGSHDQVIRDVYTGRVDDARANQMPVRRSLAIIQTVIVKSAF